MPDWAAKESSPGSVSAGPFLVSLFLLPETLAPLLALTAVIVHFLKE
jgi:hypothetical protein